MPKHSPISGSCKSYHRNTNGTCNDRGVSFSPLRQIHSKRAEVFIKTLLILVYQTIVIHALKACHNRKKKNRNGCEEKRRLHKTLLGLIAPNYQESIYTGPRRVRLDLRSLESPVMTSLTWYHPCASSQARSPLGQAEVERPPLSIKPAAEPRWCRIQLSTSWHSPHCELLRFSSPQNREDRENHGLW